MSYSHDRPTVGAAQVQDGRMDRSVFWVLVFGIALTVLGFAATWAWKAGDLASTLPKPAAQRAASAVYSAPRPDAASRQNDQARGPLAPRNGGDPRS